jgi:hypothetical protein
MEIVQRVLTSRTTVRGSASVASNWKTPRSADTFLNPLRGVAENPRRGIVDRPPLPVLLTGASGYIGGRLRALWATADLWHDETGRRLTARGVGRAREVGALTAIPFALSVLSYIHSTSGELAAAESLLDEIRAASEATGTPLQPDSRGGRCRSRTRSSRNGDAPEIGCHQVTKAAREDGRPGRPMAIRVRICQVDRHRPFEADWLVVRRQQPRAFLRPRAQPATTAAAEPRETVMFRRFLEPALPEPTVARFAHAAERQLQAVTGNPRRGPRRQTGR